ncbi:MAG: VRR-NUC domain-containing protein [Acetobacteraceae bacterium]
MQREHLFQKELAEVLARRLPPGCWWTAVDEGGLRRPWIAKARRERGCRAGAPDLLLLWRGKLTGIELKVPGNRPSQSQRAMREEILDARGRWFCCYSVQAVLQVLKRLRVPLLPDPADQPDGLRDWQRRGGINVPEPYQLDRRNPLHYPVEDPSVRRASMRMLMAAEKRKRGRRRVAQRKRRAIARKAAIAVPKCARAHARAARYRVSPLR